MRFYKLLLVVPMIAFGFAMDANAATYDCWKVTLPGQADRGANEYLFLNSKSEDYNASSSSCSHCKGDAFVCGHKAGAVMGIGGGIGGNGCYTGVKIVIDGTYTWKDSQHTGRTVFECNREGGNEWYDAGSSIGTSFSNCADVSDFQKGSKYEEMFTEGDRVFYCISSRKYRAGSGKACVVKWNGAFCYMTKTQSSCYSKKLDYDKQNDTCKCKDKNENYIDGKCVKDINNLDDQKKCAAAGGNWFNGVCKCDAGEWLDESDKHCKPKSECKSVCNSQIVVLSDIGNISNSGNSSNTNENHNNSHNTNGGGDTNPVENKACTPGTKEDMPNCDFYHNLRDSNNKFYDITGALQCAKECRSDGSGWMHYIKLCDAAKGYNCQQYEDGVGCEKCTKGRSGGGSGGGSGSSCRATRTTPEGKACCAYPNSVARYNKDTKGCDCVDTTKEFKMLDGNVGACVAKTDSPAATTPCNCTAAVTVVNTVTSNTCAAASSLVQSSVTNVNMLCPNGQPSASCNSDTLNAYVTTINMAITDCNAQPATPAKPAIDEKRLAAAVEAIDKYRSGLDVSVWKDEEGNFNTARLVSDSIAGVVLGTAGGLITSSVVKKNQVKSGFEDIMCTIGGQPVGSYGDEIQVGIQ